jgi:hypothetical protein
MREAKAASLKTRARARYGACLRFGLAVVALSLYAQAAAAQMFKCKDAEGKITYAGRECSELGLSSAGEVKGRASVTPALKAPPARPALPRAAAQDATPPAQGSEATPPPPARRCFTVKTAKGTAERCNDVPE